MPVDMDRFASDNSIYTRRLKFLETVYHQWWDLWYKDVFPHLLVRKKWKFPCRNLEEGDIVLIQSQGKLTVAEYRVARVVVTKKDSKGLVRTVIVETRPRDSREKPLPYKAKDMVRMELPVQRLALIEPKTKIFACVLVKSTVTKPTKSAKRDKRARHTRQRRQAKHDIDTVD